MLSLRYQRSPHQGRGALLLFALVVAACTQEDPCPGGICEDQNNLGACEAAVFDPSCEGNVLVVCEDERITYWNCGDGVCNESAAACGYCGNGSLDPGEECDDANSNDFDSCQNDCISSNTPCDPWSFFARCEGDDNNTLITCQDGIEVPQPCGIAACDELAGACGYCGDGVLDPEAGEECEDLNVINGDGCDNNCTTSRCGNGTTGGTEECDDENTTNGDGCDNNCTTSRCGNGATGGTEQCDDGNTSNNDVCLDTCVFNVCGDGKPLTGVEQCDDGNASNNDNCTTTCHSPQCGDGFLHTGVEECEDGNQANFDGCNYLCRAISETEPNDDFAQANLFTQADIFASNSWIGEVTPGNSGDIDYVKFYVPGDGFSVHTGLQMTCSSGVIDPLIFELLGPNGSFGVNDFEIPDFPLASNYLSAYDVSQGFYYIKIFSSSPTYCTYRLNIELIGCGDGFLDENRVEECDDGDQNSDTEPGLCPTNCRPSYYYGSEPNDDGTINTSGNFGGNDFSATNANPLPMLLSSGLTIHSDLSVAGDEDVFWLKNTSANPLTLRIETYAGEGRDTVLFVRNASGGALASDDDGGDGNCSLIPSFVLASQQSVYLHVSDYGDNDPMNYQLKVNPQ